MGYDRYPGASFSGGDDYTRDYGSGRDYTYSSARDYESAGMMGNRDRQSSDDRPYGGRDYGNQRYGQRDQQSRYETGRSGGGYGMQNDRYGERGRYGADANRGYSNEYHGSYGSGGRRFEDFGASKHADDDNYRDRYSRDYRGDRGGRGQQAYGRSQQQGYGRQPQGYDYEERGFFARAGDEVRSWFGDEEAERRREYDSRMDERSYGAQDDDYHSWRRGQIDALDRDYREYRQENRTKFSNEFSAWRTGRQGQRDLLNKVDEHMDVVGSDGEHVGTVDKVRGDRIILTKNDPAAGGHHHSIPSSWLDSVDGKVTLRKTASEAKAAWRDEERNGAMFGDDRDRDQNRTTNPYGGQSTGSTSTTTSSATTTGTTGTSGSADADGKTLNRSFSGTY
ncbi:DUF2171 domain-containing protein [Sphingomonas aquatilis]|uniref:DUF2171 domain-containing protein n=1 Tax=Sphingomonas aquatilis TaxID=93063 RepID=UPI001FBBA212|nr:DUF2171 domain-containing protein [Sphingomonas aquatilis]GKS02746.1 hypothetical protein Aug2020_04760 [Sphingomonas aquatilis]